MAGKSDLGEMVGVTVIRGVVPRKTPPKRGSISNQYRLSGRDDDHRRGGDHGDDGHPPQLEDDDGEHLGRGLGLRGDPVRPLPRPLLADKT